MVAKTKTFAFQKIKLPAIRSPRDCSNHHIITIKDSCNQRNVFVFLKCMTPVPGTYILVPYRTVHLTAAMLLRI